MSNEWLERDLEEYVKENPRALSSALFVRGGEDMEVIGTQIPCTFGRIDMLCTWRQKLIVVEFKAVCAGEKELGQVTRYASLIEKILDPYRHLSPSSFEDVGGAVATDVCRVIVAPSFDKKLFHSNCGLVSVEYEDEGGFYLAFAKAGFSFKEAQRENQKLQGILEPYEKYLAGRAIGKVISQGLGRGGTA